MGGQFSGTSFPDKDRQAWLFWGSRLAAEGRQIRARAKLQQKKQRQDQKNPLRFCSHLPSRERRDHLDPAGGDSPGDPTPRLPASLYKPLQGH